MGDIHIYNMYICFADNVVTYMIYDTLIYTLNKKAYLKLM